MAEAPASITVSAKQMGKQLRSVRRKKGLSLSEVARGAGLSRRELVAYERGKVPVPESDLWVLAGSCGVDVAELVPAPSSNELTVAASPTTIGDTVSQLRRNQADPGITPYLHTLQKLQALPPGKRIPVKERELEAIATALGSTPRAIDTKLQEVLHVDTGEAGRLRAMILTPPTGRGRARALVAPAAPEPAPVTSTVAGDAFDAFAAPAPTSTAPAASVTPVAPVAPVDTSAAPDAPLAPEPTLTVPVAPAAFLDAPRDAPIDRAHGHDVDVFAELACLPEPVPLADPSEPVPDLLQPPDLAMSPLVTAPLSGLPEGTVELVDSAVPGPSSLARSGTAGGDAPPAWNAVDAPPIDVAMRQGSSTWDLGEPPLAPAAPSSPAPGVWDTGWQPPSPPEHGAAARTGFWEGTDHWTPPGDEPSAHDGTPEVVETFSVAPAGAGPSDPDNPMSIGEDTWAGASWDPEAWSPAAPVPTDQAAPAEPATPDPWAIREWPSEPTEHGAWDHRPDEAAVASGFFVDWGTPDTEMPQGWDATPASPGPEAASPMVDASTSFDVAGAAVDAPIDALPTFDASYAYAPPEPESNGFDTTIVELTPSEWSEPHDTTDHAPAEAAAIDEPTWDPAAAVAPWASAFAPPTTPDLVEPRAAEPVAVAADPVEPEAIAAEAADAPALAPISWHVDGDEPAAEVASDDAAVAESEEPVAADPEEPVEPEPEPAPAAGQFVVAGPDWQLGNALPLVEVRSQGALVMRRADERWALADVTAVGDFVVEVEVDFRSGPGLGVLFRASTDADGRMSGYSFDIDPIYDGGGYLVRQWQSDRELWNPIARVDGTDPNSMYGKLLVRLEVAGDALVARVNDAEVLTVDDLELRSVERGREGAHGDRVGVQAWSSSDLVIDTLRVATR
jgi:hypothetical protein